MGKLYLIAMICLAAAAGCSPADVPRSAEAAVVLPNRSASARNGSVEIGSTKSQETEARLTPLVHDFHVIRPGVPVFHRFEIANNTRTRWTIATIIETCGCTVARSAQSTIESGKCGQIEVRYSPKGESRDERKIVRVDFTEPEVPSLLLIVKAQIREPLTVSPTELMLNIPGKTSDMLFNVQNYGPKDWGALQITVSEDWLRVVASPAQLPIGAGNGGSARQVWRVTAKCEKHLPIGHHTATIAIRPDDEPSFDPKILLVEVRVRAPVAAIPGQFFFGSVLVGKPATRDIVIRFRDDLRPPAPETIKLHYRGGGKLTLTWIKTEGTVWHLRATLVSRAEEKFVNGEVGLEFPVPGVSDLLIPVNAIVSGRGP